MRKFAGKIRGLRSVVLALVLVAVLALGVMLPPAQVEAADSQNVTVTATPAFIGIANAPGTWDINGITGSGKIAPSTTYWTNPLGDTTSPTVGGALDAEARFTITNTSTIAIDLTVTFPNHAGGDASTNSDNDTPGANAFGARSYFTGQASGAWALAKAAAPVVGKDALAATTDIKWGLKYQSQTGAWTSGTAMTSTVNILATAD